MSVQYQQACASCHGDSEVRCNICGGKGFIVGNGSALTNPVASRALVQWDGLVDNVVRAVEDYA